MLEAVVARFAQTAPFLVIGLAIEAATRQRHLPPDTSHRVNLVYMLALFLVDTITLSMIVIALADLLAILPGAGLLNPLVPHPVAAAALWLICRDFCYYWFHRAQHASSWLWGQHAWHHSDETMNVTTTSRHHWLENPLQYVCVLVPATYLIQPSASVMVGATVLINAVAHLIHMNAPWPLPWLNGFLANPQTHRIHHSVAPEHRDRNFAATFQFWDVLFGTYAAPTPGEQPQAGLVTPTARWRLLAWPFVRS